MKTEEKTLVCNGCVNIITEPLEGSDGAFCARCKEFFIKTNSGTKERTVSFRSYSNTLIKRPEWCPILESNKGKSKIHDLTSFIKHTIVAPFTPKKEVVPEPEPVLDIEPMTPWDSLEVMNVGYIIPPVFKKKRRVVYIKEKTANSIKVGVMYEDGTTINREETYLKNSVEAKLIVKFRPF